MARDCVHREQQRGCVQEDDGCEQEPQADGLARMLGGQARRLGHQQDRRQCDLESGRRRQRALGDHVDVAELPVDERPRTVDQAPQVGRRDELEVTPVETCMAQEAVRQDGDEHGARRHHGRASFDQPRRNPCGCARPTLDPPSPELCAVHLPPQWPLQVRTAVQSRVWRRGAGLSMGLSDHFSRGRSRCRSSSVHQSPVRYGSLMGETFVSVERRPDGVALVRLDRPKANALSAAVLGQLEEAATGLVDDPPGAVVLWGGRRIFAAGADIVELESIGAEAVGRNFAAALGALAAVPRATIAAVNGFALGGGLELALACDFRVGAEDSKFGVPEILLGVIPGGGGTQRLPRLVGSSRAKEMIMTGRQVRADEALSIGLVNRVVAPDYALEVALTWAAELAAGPVVAHGLAKGAVDRGLDGTLEEGLAIEREAFAAVFRTEDAAIGIRSFSENGPGKATFVGR